MFVTQFDSEERAFRNRKTTVSAVVTILVHSLLLLFLILAILHTPIPPFEDNAGGMAVNFGTDLSGVGNEQPFTYNPGPVAGKVLAAAAKTQPVESSPDNPLTQDNEDTKVTVPKSDDKPKPKIDINAVLKKHTKRTETTATTSNNTTVANPAPQPKPIAGAMFQRGAYGQPNKSKGDGTGGVQGDQGQPTGDVNSHNYLGDGDGKGQGHGHGDLKGGYSLRGRKNTGLPAPNQCNNPGKVVIAIKVDKTGKVIDATFKRFESTVFDDCNKNNALSAARRATFNSDPGAPDVQEGTITYVYEVH